MTEETIVRARCVVCGCTEEAACEGGCAWANADRTVCTRCAPLDQAESIERIREEVRRRTTPSGWVKLRAPLVLGLLDSLEVALEAAPGSRLVALADAAHPEDVHLVDPATVSCISPVPMGGRTSPASVVRAADAGVVVAGRPADVARALGLRVEGPRNVPHAPPAPSVVADGSRDGDTVTAEVGPEPTGAV